LHGIRPCQVYDTCRRTTCPIAFVPVERLSSNPSLALAGRPREISHMIGFF
jgi:hypothetical protein